MARVFLSTLGTNRYVECHYVLNGKKSVCTPFIQESLAELLCRSWREEDKIFIFCTDAARENNWCDSVNFDHGLETRLRKLSLKPTVECRWIPEGRSEKEIMDIFNIVSGSLDQNDEVILDITHSFRSLPLLNAVILNYAKMLKQIDVQGIYYGAFEFLGTREQAEKLLPEDRNAPIFDLSPYDTLLDWARAVDDFVRHGWAEGLQSLVVQKVSPVLGKKTDKKKQEEGKREYDTAYSLRKLIDELQAMSKSIATCRCFKIEQFASLKDRVEKIKGQELIPPLNPLLDLIARKTDSFKTPSEEEKGFEAVDWCISHNLVPQGYTILRETIVSGMCRLLGLDVEAFTDREGFVSSLLSVVGRKKPEEEWKGDLVKRKEEAQEIIAAYGEPLQDLAKAFQALTELRNDINHGGCRKGCTGADTLINELRKKFESARTAWSGILDQHSKQHRVRSAI